MNTRSTRGASCALSKARNQQLKCSHRGCQLPRKGLHRWCSSHRVKARRYGHPDGRALRPMEIKQARSAVDRLFWSNPEHSGVKAAAAYLEDWMRRGAGGDSSIPGAKDDWQRLLASGVTSMQVLKELCAVFLLSRTSPSGLPDDQRLDFAMSRAVLGLAPARTRISRSGKVHRVEPSYAALRSIGRLARSSLAPFLVAVVSAVDGLPEADRRLREALRTPFSAPTNV
jgi:hypothetical protein